jgi:hypothetical protein
MDSTQFSVKYNIRQMAKHATKANMGRRGIVLLAVNLGSALLLYTCGKTYMHSTSIRYKKNLNSVDTSSKIHRQKLTPACAVSMCVPWFEINVKYLLKYRRQTLKDSFLYTHTHTFLL